MSGTAAGQKRSHDCHNVISRKFSCGSHARHPSGVSWPCRLTHRRESSMASVNGVTTFESAPTASSDGAIIDVKHAGTAQQSVSFTPISGVGADAGLDDVVKLRPPGDAARQLHRRFVPDAGGRRQDGRRQRGPEPNAGRATQPRLRRRMRLYRLYEGRGTSTWNSYAVVGEETPGVPDPGVSGRYDRQARLRALPKHQVGDRARPFPGCGARGKRLG